MARKEKHQGLVWLILGLVGAAVLGALAGIWLSSGGNTPQTGAQTPKNEYRAQGFYREDGFLRYADAEHAVGIDVSVHQGLIDWQAVADSGVEFAILRVGYRGSTVGELYGDEQFRENFQGARDAGLKLGVYFFSQARNEAEAREEADFACELLDGAELELPVYYDWEVVDGGSRVTHPAEVDMTACAVAFCERVEAAGYTAGVYFNQNYGLYYLDLGALADYHLWLAEYDDTPDFAYHFDCVQYTDSGTVAGIEGRVDMDLLIFTQEDKMHAAASSENE